MKSIEDRLNRLKKINKWYKVYKKINPNNSIHTNFVLAKMSYEHEYEIDGRVYTGIFTPYIPNIVVKK